MTAQAQDPALFSACDLLRAYRARSLSPVEATRAVLARIARFDKFVRGFVLVDEEAALQAARASEARWMRGERVGLVDGVPTTVKDLLLTKGWPTLRGSRLVARDQDWNEDAPAVARLREEGAVLIGKTTTPEFGWKGVTDSALTGITRNPWDTTRTPGGSSGGAAVAAALGFGALHLGTDGGGSIRIPAGFTGIFGLKPSFGRVPAYPPSPFGTVAHVGPMTREAGDGALLLNVIARPDPRDPFALPEDGRDYRIGLERGVAGLRVAYSRTLGFARVDPEVAAAVDGAVRAMAELGAWVEETDPKIPDPRDCFAKHWLTGAANLLRTLQADRHGEIDRGLVEAAQQGAAIAHMEYQAAVRERVELAQAMRLFHERYDLLVTPTLPIAAFAAGQELADPARERRWPDWTPFSFPFNLTGQPAASVPCGLVQGGLPVGVQIVGGPYQDALVLRAARALEAALPRRLPDPARLLAGGPA